MKKVIRDAIGTSGKMSAQVICGGRLSQVYTHFSAIR